MEDQEVSPDVQMHTVEFRQRAHTASPVKPPSHRFVSAEEVQVGRKRIDYHQRNIENIRQIAYRKSQQFQALQLEQRRQELAQQRLSHLVLARCKRSNPDDGKALLPPISSEPENNQPKKTQVQAYYRSRYSSLLKSLQEQNRMRQEADERERLKQIQKQEKLKEEFGLKNVASKLHEPTVASLVASNHLSEEDLLHLKEGKADKIQFSPATKNGKKSEFDDPLTEEGRERQKVAKDASEKIRKRALEHLQQLSEKRQSELRRAQELQAKVVKLKSLARDTVLSMRKTVLCGMTKSDSQESLGEEEAEQKPRSIDPEILIKLAKHRRNNAPMITDFQQWKRRNRVGEKTRVFMILGGYPDVRKAMERRGME